MDPAALMFWTFVQVAALHQPRVAEFVTVGGTPIRVATPAAVTTLSADALAASPAATLDDALRSVPGFSLLRRSSSRVANPTTQGVTLRGLAASGASRALVLADEVPINDPVGGWVYWGRLPLAALSQVTVARGAAGDLHGADALAGAVTLRTSTAAGIRGLAEAGGRGTARASVFGGVSAPAGLFASAERVTTDGFVLVEPASRGAVDVAASSRHTTGFARATFPAPVPVTIAASHLDESRGNGTPLQRNATRVSDVSIGTQAVAASGTWGWSGTVHASTHDYTQTFSAVLGGRAAERLTSAQQVEAGAAGVTARSWLATGPFDIAVSVAGRWIDARLSETAYGLTGAAAPATAIDAAQFTGGIAAQGAYRGPRVSAGAGARLQRWRTTGADAHVFATPRVWTTVSLAPSVSLTGALLTGFRGPSINELFRPFRVGSVVTNANPGLRPERALGIESGVIWTPPRTRARAVLFWSRVTDAVVNVTLSEAGGTIVRERQNAARIRARGIEVELETRISPTLSLTASSTLTDSRFDDGTLAGLRVPQVPRFRQSAGLRCIAGRWSVSADWHLVSPQFDDDRNLFSLDQSSMIDVRAGWRLRRSVEVFGAVENLLDEEQDVGRTPIRTLGLPRSARAGVRLAF